MERLPSDKIPHQLQSTSLSTKAILIGLIIFLLVLLAAWLILADVFKISAKAMAFAGEMSGIVFTLGGIVVALASLVTLVSIEDRVKGAFLDAQNAVMTQHESRVNAQVEAHLSFLRATLASDWRQADKEAKEAIQKYPALSGVRSFVGLKMFDQVQSTFFLNHVDFQDGLRYARPDMAASPSMEALEWLQDAVSYNDQASTCQAALAMLSGILGRYDRTIEYLNQLPDSNKNGLLSPIALIALAHACRGDSACLHELGQKLGIHWPVPLDMVSQEIVTQSTASRSMNPEFPAYFKWWVSPKNGAGISAKEYPRVVLIRPFGTASPETSANASYWASGDFHNIPESDEEASVPYNELMRQLGEKFWFLCPDSPPDQVRQFLHEQGDS